MNEHFDNIKALLKASIERNTPDGILLSGGFDTSVLATFVPGITAVSVRLESWGEDYVYAKKVSELFDFKHHCLQVTVEEAIDAIPEVVKILKSFDPAVPNDVVVYLGMKKAKELGICNIMTGDGSDELFGGYSFMQGIGNLNEYIKAISQNMFFSSNEIINVFDMQVVQPFISEDMRDYAVSLDADLKICKEDGIVHGKWILRKTFEDVLPKDIVWQSKRPLEVGSGMSKLRDIISARVDVDEYKTNPDGIGFINKEHMYYYNLYKKIIGPVKQCEKEEFKCKACGAELNKSKTHCRTCGWAKPL